jgi:hypothetical protein
MELYEKALRVSVETAFADLVGMNLDEGVVPPLHLHGKNQRTEQSGVCAGSRRVRRALERKRRKEFIGHAQDIRRRELGSEEV